MKRSLSLLLAMALCLGLGVTALADGAVELPGVEELVSTIVEGYGGTVEYAERQRLSPDNGGNGWAVTIQVGGTDDLYSVMDLLRTCLDTWLWLADFSLVSGQAPESYEDKWEYVYSYPDGGVGTVYSPNGAAACNAAFTEEVLGGDRFVVQVFLGEGVTMAEGAPEQSWDGYLPDPGAFFQCGVDESGTIHEDKGRGYFTTYDLSIDSEQAVDEFLALLRDGPFNLEEYDVSGQEDFTFEGTTYILRRFGYTGDAPGIGEILDASSKPEYPGAVFVRVNYYYGRGYIGLAMYYSDGFTLADTGNRASDLPQDVSGASGSGAGDPSGGIDWDDDDDGRRKCTYCGGDGTRDCMTCGGKGYIEEYVSVPNYSGSTLGSSSGWERHDCPNFSCRDGQVDCGFCGGDGWID